MNIGFVTNLYMPDTGGAEILLNRLITDLAARGHEVSLVVPRCRRQPESLAYPRIRSISPVSRRFQGMQVLPFLWWCRRRHRVDLVHCHGELGPAVAAAHLQRVCGVPFVCRALGGGFIAADDFSPLRHAARRALSKAGGFIAQGEFLRSRILSYGVPESRVETINNGVRVEEVTRHRDGPCPVRPPYVLHVGGLKRAKGWDVALKAFAQIAGDVPDVTLVMAGKQKQRQAFRDLCHDLDIADRVINLGLCDRSTVSALFCHAGVYLCPFRRSPFSNANLEAMAAGTPVVASAVDGNLEQIRDGVEGLLVPPDDPDATARALRRILTDETMRAAMSARALQRAEFYSWDRMVDRYEAAYERVVAEAAQSARG